MKIIISNEVLVVKLPVKYFVILKIVEYLDLLISVKDCFVLFIFLLGVIQVSGQTAKSKYLCVGYQIPEKFRKANFNTVLSEKKIMDGYTVQSIAIDGLPGHQITGNLYMPLELKEKNPIIVSFNGHWFNPGNSMGVSDQMFRNVV